MRAPLAPPRLSEPRKVDADAHAVETSCEIVRPGRKDLGLQSSGVLLGDQWMIHRGNRILPQQLLLRNKRAEIARDRAHVAVRQLEPRLGERISELGQDARRNAAKFSRKPGRTRTQDR